MPSLKTYIDSPLFYDGAELSATDLNILRNNAEAVKYAALMGLFPHQIHRNINVTNNSGYVWKGGFMYRAGLTTARFIIWSKEVSGMGSHDIVIKFNGAEVARYNAAVGGYNVGGFQTTDIAVTGRGYADYEIVSVTVTIERTSGTADASKGEQYVFDAYTFPWSNVGSGIWPGVPSFGTLTATKLNQLANALDYLAIRTGQIQTPLEMNIFKWTGTGNPKYPKFRWFRVKPANQNGYLRTKIYYMCETNNTSIVMRIGSAVWTYGPYSKGQRVTIDIFENLIAAGLSWNVDYLATLEESIPPANFRDNSDGNGGFIFQKIDSYPISIENPNGYTTVATPVTNQILESMSFASLQSRLNSIASVVSEAYGNITGNPMIYDRGYMFRDRYGIKDEQNEYFDTTFVAGKRRWGDVLWVKGQDLKIAYGPIATEPKDKDKANGPWTFKPLFEESLTDSDKISQNYFYLDQFNGLYPGMFYWVYGKDIHYAAETLR